MADDQYDDNDNDSGDDKKPNWRRDLERDAQAGREAVKELEAYKRRDAARSAGLDPDKPLVAMFLKSYDGEVSAAAIKDAAAEVGLIDTDSTSDGATADDQAPPHPAQAGMDAIGQAAGSPATMPTDIAAEMEKAYDEGGADALLDVVQKHGVAVTTRQ